MSIAQPAALAYGSSTLYGASEQAVGGATAVAALSIASIIGPQVRSWHALPILDADSLVDFLHPRQIVVRSRLLCCMCHVGVHAGRLCKSAALAPLESSRTQAQVWSRPATKSYGRRAACQSFGGCPGTGNRAGHGRGKTSWKRRDHSSC